MYITTRKAHNKLYCTRVCVCRGLSHIPDHCKSYSWCDDFWDKVYFLQDQCACCPDPRPDLELPQASYWSGKLPERSIWRWSGARCLSSSTFRHCKYTTMLDSGERYICFLCLQVFLDEVNTSSCLGLFKEIILDRTFDGEVQCRHVWASWVL